MVDIINKFIGTSLIKRFSSPTESICYFILSSMELCKSNINDLGGAG
jgi:hypothetical protein